MNERITHEQSIPVKQVVRICRRGVGEDEKDYQNISETKGKRKTTTCSTNEHSKYM